jgi:regulator of protease activity HflC (stomatin/prohibitin superfamily)
LPRIKRRRRGKMEFDIKTFVLSTAGIISILFVLIVVFGAFYSVPPGSVGVKFRSTGPNQGFQPDEIQQGWGFKMPLIETVYEIPFRTQTIGFYGPNEEQGTYSAITPMDKNGITFNVDVTVRYRLDPTQAAEFIEQKGQGVASMDTLLATAVRADSTRGVFGKYAQEDTPDKRLELAAEVQKVLQHRIDQEASGKLKPGFITIEAVDIRDVKFNDQIAARIIEKQKKLQEAQQKVYELESAQRTREIELVNADRDRNATILRAQGEAEATLIVATAKAQGIEKVNQAYQNMPASYVSTQWAQAIQPTDKIIFGLDNLGGGGLLPILNVNQLIAANVTG